jgi:TRAP-type mannitol/chloroaromatic compound transport system permease small subunit
MSLSSPPLILFVFFVLPLSLFLVFVVLVHQIAGCEKLETSEYDHGVVVFEIWES